MTNTTDTGVLTSPQWRDSAVAAVLDGLYRRNPGMAETLGPRAKAACRQDIHHHLDYLAGAEVTSDAPGFARYALWLKDVLRRRGVPVQSLGDSFELLAAYCAEQLPENRAKPLCRILAAGLEALEQPDLPTPHVLTRLPALPGTTPYREAVLGGDHHTASELMQVAMQGGVSLSEAAVRLIQPAMYDIGRLWQENQISVAQEHMATAITQNILAQAYLQARFAPPGGRSAMFAAVAGNHHSLGLRILSDAFETAGWRATYLGPDVPTNALLREIDTQRPDLLCLSLSLPIHLTTAQVAIAALRSELGSRCPTIWVGGQATLLGDPAWRALNADGWAYDALHALEQSEPCPR